MQAKISTWDQAKELGLREAEKRLGVKIEKYWPNSISLEPTTHGGLWDVRLELQVKKSLGKKALIRVSMKLDPKTGEVKEFKAEQS